MLRPVIVGFVAVPSAGSGTGSDPIGSKWLNGTTMLVNGSSASNTNLVSLYDTDTQGNTGWVSTFLTLKNFIAILTVKTTNGTCVFQVNSVVDGGSGQVNFSVNFLGGLDITWTTTNYFVDISTGKDSTVFVIGNSISGSITINAVNGSRQYCSLDTDTTFGVTGGNDMDTIHVGIAYTNNALNLNFASVQMSTAALAALPVALEQFKAYSFDLLKVGGNWKLLNFDGPTVESED